MHVKNRCIAVDDNFELCSSSSICEQATKSCRASASPAPYSAALNLAHRTAHHRVSVAWLLTLLKGLAVHGAGGGPALADAVEAAVAQVAAHGADPGVLAPLCHGLLNVLPIPHEQAVSAEDTLHTQ